MHFNSFDIVDNYNKLIQRVNVINYLSLLICFIIYYFLYKLSSRSLEYTRDIYFYFSSHISKKLCLVLKLQVYLTWKNIIKLIFLYESENNHILHAF